MNDVKKNPPIVDWRLLVSILFWIAVVAGFSTLISYGKTEIPRAVLEITEASASRKSLIIVHREGEPIRFANTRCIWTPDVSSPNVTEEAGFLVMAGEERKQGVVSKLEPDEAAKLQRSVSMNAGRVGRLLIVDRMSGQPIFSRTVKMTR